MGRRGRVTHGADRVVCVRAQLALFTHAAGGREPPAA